MNFYTTTTFRHTLAALTKKPKEGYMSVVKDICKTFFPWILVSSVIPMTASSNLRTSVS